MAKFFLLLLLVNTKLLYSGVYTFKPLKLINYEAPPSNLIGLFPKSHIDYEAIKKRYTTLAKKLKLKNVLDHIHEEIFYEAYMRGLIDRDRINELTIETLKEIKNRFKQGKTNARFAVTFFHKNRVASDFHEQARFITQKNNTRFNYDSLNEYIINDKLVEKYFPEFSFVDKKLYGHLFTYKTHLLKQLDPQKYSTLVKDVKKNKRVKVHFDNFLEGYGLSEKYWYGSVIKIFQNENWIVSNDKQTSSFKLVNALWDNVLKNSPQIEQISASIASSPYFNLNTDFFNTLIEPNDAVSTKYWKPESLYRKQLVFNETLKSWDKINDSAQYLTLQEFSKNSHYTFTKRVPMIEYGFGLPTFALLIESLTSLNRLAFKNILARNYFLDKDKVSIKHDEFWETGVAIYFTSLIIDKIKNIHPFIEYWFLVHLLSINNLENYVFTKNILSPLKNNYLQVIKQTPTIDSLLKNDKILKTIFEFHKIVNPVYTRPGSNDLEWPEIKVLKKNRDFNIVLDQGKSQDESGNTKSE